MEDELMKSEKKVHSCRFWYHYLFDCLSSGRAHLHSAPLPPSHRVFHCLVSATEIGRLQAYLLLLLLLL